MDINKICRTCLSVNEQLIPLFDGSAEHSSAKMLESFTNIRLKNIETMPTKVCLACIRELNRCFSFKIKCENSNRTLHQLMPGAMEDDPDEEEMLKSFIKLQLHDAYTQTEVTIKTEQNEIPKNTINQSVQTDINAEMLCAPILEVNTEDLKESQYKAPQNEDDVVLESEGNQSNDEDMNITLDDQGVEKQLAVNEYTKKKLKCTQCVMQFASEYWLKRHVGKMHMATKENEQKLLETIDISSSSESANEEKEEEQQNTTESIITPKKKNATQSGTKGELLHTCFDCGRTFAARILLLEHRKMKLCKVMSYKCNECARVFNSEAELKLHNVTHLLLHACPECNERFSKAIFLEQHLINVHDRNPNHQCKVCKKVFSTLPSLKFHLRLHNTELFTCGLCDKSFSQQPNLKLHLLRSHNTHTVVKPYQCNYCQSTFSKSITLAQHKRLLHNGKRTYTCDTCPMRFTTLNLLNNHLRTHTR